jgi:hypothetical protein
MVYSITIEWGSFSLYYHNWSLVFMVISEFGLLMSSLTKNYPEEVYNVYAWILKVSLGTDEEIDQYMEEMGIKDINN